LPNLPFRGQYGPAVWALERCLRSATHAAVTGMTGSNRNSAVGARSRRVLRDRRSLAAASLASLALLALALLALATVLTPACRRPRLGPARPDLPALAPITALDRVLVVAPHEDDEALAAAGLIQQAVAAGAPVRVVYLTYGDHNELAFVVYRRRPWVTPGINREMGKLRRREAVAATGKLGLAPKDLVFLGYPDGGMLGIWKQHWGKSPPLRSRLTDAAAVPYAEAASFGKAHKGENVTSDLAVELLQMRPTRILVAHPDDSNPDHRACWLFLQAALLETAGRMPSPDVLAYPVHAGAWPRPRGEHVEEWLDVPRRLKGGPGTWRMLELTPQQVRHKAEAIRIYRTQTSVSAGYLLSFARRDELFEAITPASPLAAARIAEAASAERPHALMYAPDEADPGDEPSTERIASSAGPDAGLEVEREVERDADPVGSVLFRDLGQALVVDVRLRPGVVAGTGLSARAFGFRADRPFARSPKLRIVWAPGWLWVYDQRVQVVHSRIRVTEERGRVTVTIPWEELDDPRWVFVQVDGVAGDLPPRQTGWRLLERTGRP